MLISKTDFTCKSYLKIRGYKIYDTKRTNGNAHGVTAIVIKNTIKHHELTMFQKDHIEATSIAIGDEKFRPIVLSAT